MVDADPLVLLHAKRVRRVLAARETLTAYLRGVIAERRRTPGHDLISALIAVEEEGEVLRESDLIVMLNLLLISGHETSSSLIGNGIVALLHHPEQLDQLRTRPQLIESAVEELLRWDSPVQLTIPTGSISRAARTRTSPSAAASTSRVLGVVLRVGGAGGSRDAQGVSIR